MILILIAVVPRLYAEFYTLSRSQVPRALRADLVYLVPGAGRDGTSCGDRHKGYYTTSSINMPISAASRTYDTIRVLMLIEKGRNNRKIKSILLCCCLRVYTRESARQSSLSLRVQGMRTLRVSPAAQRTGEWMHGWMEDWVYGCMDEGRIKPQG